MVLLIAIMIIACSAVTKPVQIETPISTASSTNWKTYSSETFLVTLNYPEYWEIDNEGNAFIGQDGFFQISATSMLAPTAKEACENDIQVNHSGKENRYGTKPTLEILLVDNQPACLILPSDDQPQDKHGLSFLVVEYPDLAQGHVRLLQLFADKNHIHDFVSSLKFIRN